jgi:hypothetical protein
VIALEQPGLLIFLHIPKAAGSSFYRVLDRQYPREAIYRTHPLEWRESIEELRALPEERRRALRVLEGHMGFGLHELFPQPARYVTFVRDPVARVVSHYGYVLRTPKHYLHNEVAGRRLSLLEYATSGLTHELVNGQTRLLSALDDSKVEPTPEALELAKRNVEEHFVLAGSTERFDESLLLLRRALGWRNVLYRRENAAPRSTGSSPDPDAVEAIREGNRLDQELYDFCSRRFGELVAAAGPSLERELQRFRKRNAVYGALSTSASRARARGRRARV